MKRNMLKISLLMLTTLMLAGCDGGSNKDSSSEHPSDDPIVEKGEYPIVDDGMPD